MLALRALGVGPGDEVVVPSFTFYASAEAIPHTGARPVFCDVDPRRSASRRTPCAPRMTPRTKAVIAVHLFGNVAPVAEIEALGVPVLEDAAQAAGALAADGRRAGALGTIATFSFYPSKNLGAFGDGGAITTSDAALAERVRMLRFHGSRDKETFELVGHNSRLDELQAALLRVTLPHLDALVRRPPRRRRALRGGGPRRARRAAARRRRLRARLAPLRRPPPAGRRRSPPRSRRPGSAARPTTACRPTASRRCASRATASSCPARTRSPARTSRSP